MIWANCDCNSEPEGQRTVMEFFRLLKKASIALVLLGSCASFRAQVIQVTAMREPLLLRPLPMHAGGRVLVMRGDAVDGLGAEMYETQWPGSYFEAGFRGAEVYFRLGKNDEALDVAVDGQAPVKLVKPAVGVYRVSGLRAGAHAVRVSVITESQPEPNVFGGFGIGAEGTATAPPKRSRQIEFIGDSHTVGYGNTSVKRECTTEEVWATTDSAAAFGPMVAGHYGADYQVNAISGHGVVRNYDGSAGDPVPVAYPYVLFDKRERYEDPAWKPEVIVIALGTNDFSTSLHAGERWKSREELHADYEGTYVRFVQQLRAENAGAYFVLWATEKADGEIEAEVGKVVGRLKAGGEKRVAFLPIDGLSFGGCHAHPSVADDGVIAAKLEGVIDAQPGIWQGK